MQVSSEPDEAVDAGDLPERSSTSAEALNEPPPDPVSEEIAASPPPTPSPRFYYSTRSTLQVDPDNTSGEEGLLETPDETPPSESDLTSSPAEALVESTTNEPSRATSERTNAEEPVISERNEPREQLVDPVHPGESFAFSRENDASQEEKSVDPERKVLESSYHEAEPSTAEYLVEPDITKSDPLFQPHLEPDRPTSEEPSQGAGALDEIMDACRQSETNNHLTEVHDVQLVILLDYGLKISC